LNALLYKPILGIIGKRKQKMDESDSEIKRMNQTVEQKMAEYEEKVRLAKVDAMEQKNAIVKQGSDVAKGIIDAVRVKSGNDGAVPRQMEKEVEKQEPFYTVNPRKYHLILLKKCWKEYPMNSHFSKHRLGRSFVKFFAWIIVSVLIMAVDVYASAGGGESKGHNWLILPGGR